MPSSPSGSSPATGWRCAGKLARFKIPKEAGFVESIPRNPTGKALERVLRERFPEPAHE